MFRPGGTDLDLILETFPRVIEDQKECIAPLKVIELRELRTQESQILPRALLRALGELRELKNQESQTLLRARLRVLGELRELKNQEYQTLLRARLREIGELRELKTQEGQSLLRALGDPRVLGERGELMIQESQSLLKAIGEPMRGRILLMSAESLGIGIGTRERILLQKLTLL